VMSAPLARFVGTWRTTGAHPGIWTILFSYGQHIATRSLRGARCSALGLSCASADRVLHAARPIRPAGSWVRDMSCREATLLQHNETRQ